MIVSCFNDKSGMYDYYEAASATYPFNADLPTPNMPAEIGKIGVPAIDAARNRPRDAKLVGRGWHARGVVVDCSKNGSMGLGSDDGSSTLGSVMSIRFLPVLVFIGAAVAYDNMSKKNETNRKLVLLGGATVGTALAWKQWRDSQS